MLAERIKVKKQLTLLVLLVSLNTAAFAESFDIRGKVITVPPPDGYVRVTKEMGTVYRVNQQMFDPMNDLLAYYISESDAAIAMEGDVSPNERTFMLKVSKKIKGMVVGSQDFAELKSMTKKQNQEIFESVKSEFTGFFEKTSEGISKEFDVDIALQLSQVIPLDPHYESENALAYSMYINFGIALEGNKEDIAVSATATFVNASGKVIFLYCYAPKEELEWTRSASKAWAESVMASNPLPPTRSSGGRGINWSKILGKGIGGAIAGGLIALVLALLRCFVPKVKEDIIIPRKKAEFSKDNVNDGKTS